MSIKISNRQFLCLRAVV